MKRQAVAKEGGRPRASGQKTTTPTRPAGGVFVVMSSDWKCWGKDGWVDSWRDAVQFSALDMHFPYGPCEKLTGEVRARTGVPCNAFYFPLHTTWSGPTSASGGGKSVSPAAA